MSKRFSSAAELLAAAGTDLGTTDWLEITQERVNLFADATGDHQWIHVDVERATRENGGTIAHGFLTLSLMAKFSADTFDVTDVTRRLNYGFDKIRFTEPVRAGDRIRMTHRLVRAEEKSGGLMLTRDCRVEIEGRPRPAIVAEWVLLVVP